MVNYYSDDNMYLESPGDPVKLPSDAMNTRALIKYLNNEVFPAFDHERRRIRRLEAWGAGRQPEVRPLKRNTERAILQRLARTPWIPLMISTFAQQMVVDGYRREGDLENQEAWETWEFNDMHSQQLSLNRATMIAGYSYLRVTQGIRDAGGQVMPADSGGEKMAVMRGVSPARCFALYADPFGDEYPEYVLEKRFDGSWRWWFNGEGYHVLNFDGSKFKLVETREHDYGVNPFVRYVNQIDLEGRTWGEVEPVVDLAARMDKTAFDRLLVQHFNSFKVRWATGLEQPDSEEEVTQDKIRIANEDILIASDVQAKFGTLDETSMGGFIDAYKADLEAFTAVTQLPPNLISQVVNVAADALDGARRQTYQKLFEKQTMFGARHAQALRLAAHIEGREDDANDFSARIHWQDVEVRSLGQFADAWGKIVSQLGVPKWATWNKIPGVNQSEVKEWKEHWDDNDPLNLYLRDLNVKPAAAQPGSPAGSVADGRGGTNSTANQPRLNNRTGLSN
jgi:hypothetical protein